MGKREEIGLGNCDPTQLNRLFKETYLLNLIGKKAREKQFLACLKLLLPFPEEVIN